MMRPEVLSFSNTDLPLYKQWAKALIMGSGTASLKETFALMWMKLLFTELTENGSDNAPVNCDYSLISLYPKNNFYLSYLANFLCFIYASILLKNNNRNKNKHFTVKVSASGTF